MYAGNYPLATALGGLEVIGVQGGLVQAPISLFDQRYAALAAQAAQNLNAFNVLGTQGGASALAPLSLFDSRYIAGSLAPYPSAPDVNGLVLAGSRSGQIVQAPIALFDARYFPRANANAIDVTAPPFNAKGDGVADDTAPIQAALNTGLNVDFVGLAYKANNLVMPNVLSPIQSSAQQCLFSSRGPAQVTKNANGNLITSVVRDVQFINMQFRGDASVPQFTGHNIVSRGDNFALINCGSRWASGRALLHTGDHLQIIGQTDIYQTADQTATGYDIEIGLAGKATLYHQIFGVYTSQRAGGILMTDTGSAVIHGGQFGKLTIAAGTSPGGVNGGLTFGARILGNITVGLPNAVLASNQIDAVAVVFQVGTSQCSLDQSNVYANGATITNNGNANNYIARQVSAGTVSQLRLGDDTSLANLGSQASSGLIFSTAGWAIGSQTGPQMLQGTGSPLNAVSAPVGSIFLRSDGGANTTLYVKEGGGTGSTGWVAK